MPTANEAYFDAALRHQVGIRRFATGEVKMILRILQDADRELIRKLRVSLAKLKGRYTQRRLESLLRDVKAARRELVVELRRRLRPDLLELAVDEVAFEQALIQAAVPWTVGFAQVNLTQVRAAVTSKPFNGRFLRQWWQSLSTRDAANVEQAIRLGFAQGETTQQMVTRLAGTRREGFRDGILSITRRDAEGVVRTAVNHVSNAAREAVWEANPEMIAGLRWTATLDGRTTRICAARDGRVAPAEGREAPAGYPLLVPPGARPPAHFNCRSVMIAILDGEGLIGRRPSVVDVRTAARRELDFRKIARQTGRPIREVRAEWAREAVGQVPSETTYNQWLQRQKASFQDEVLGRTRGKLFRKGDLDVQQFVDRFGNELTLEQLRATLPQAFELAGLS
jgi:SPP1 gp7 family putative phage head morphogenesis protein